MAHLWRDYEKLCMAYISKLTKNNWGISRTHFKNEPHLAKQWKRIIQTLHIMWNIKKEALTFVVQLCPELCKALQTDLLTQQFEKLVQCGTTTLIVVHLFLCALACLAVQDAHLVLVAQLQITKRISVSIIQFSKKVSYYISVNCKTLNYNGR